MITWLFSGFIGSSIDIKGTLFYDWLIELQWNGMQIRKKVTDEIGDEISAFDRICELSRAPGQTGETGTGVSSVRLEKILVKFLLQSKEKLVCTKLSNQFETLANQAQL
jgi:hypothetical protein